MLLLDKNNQMLFRDMMFSIKSMQQTLTQESDCPLIKHEKTSQITYVESGSGICKRGKDEVKLSAGTIVFIAAGTPHSFKALDSKLLLIHYHWNNEAVVQDRIIIKPSYSFMEN